MSADDAALAAAEREIGHSFRDRALLETALTHASALADFGGSARQTYERFEFLGDRVLGLVVAEMLLTAFPDAPEGELSPRLAALVRKETCADVAVALKLGDAIITAGGRQQQRALQTKNVLGDVCEAVIAAIFLDGGLDAARRFIEINWRPRMMSSKRPTRDAKTLLQEWAQARGLPAPRYVLTERRGPHHESVFYVEVGVPDLAPARGEGRTRRDAEQAAAGAMLAREGVVKDEA